MSHLLGNLKPFLGKGTARGEGAQFGMAAGEAATGEHGGQEELTEVLVAQHPLKGRHGLPEAGDRPTIVALGLDRRGRGSSSPAGAG